MQTYNRNYIEKAIETAWTEFSKNDWELLERDANERSITHKFAKYLEPLFSDWDVDCEYNRDGVETKRLHLIPKQIWSDDDKGETVYPDIMAHERGTENNLLVMEAKKDTSEDKEGKDDKKKLAAYMNERSKKCARNQASGS